MPNDKFSVAGMTYGSYDPDKDPSGEIGHRLAEMELRGRGSFERGHEALERKYDTATLRVIAIATLGSFPALNPRERRSAQDYKKRLRNIRDAGYKDLPAHSHLDLEGAKEVYELVVGDVRAQVRAHCPQVFIEIGEINAASDAEDELMR